MAAVCTLSFQAGNFVFLAATLMKTLYQASW